MSTSALETAVAAATSAAATAMATAAADNDATPPCPAGNEYNGDIGLRVSAIFVILVGSVFGPHSFLEAAMSRLTAEL